MLAIVTPLLVPWITIRWGWEMAFIVTGALGLTGRAEVVLQRRWGAPTALGPSVRLIASVQATAGRPARGGLVRGGRGLDDRPCARRLPHRQARRRDQRRHGKQQLGRPDDPQQVRHDEVAGPGPVGRGADHGDGAADGANVRALTGHDGKPRTLADFKGKVVLLMFWSTECAVCRDKMPELRQNYAGWNGKPFEMVLVSTDRKMQDVQDYERIISRTVSAAKSMARWPSTWSFPPPEWPGSLPILTTWRRRRFRLPPSRRGVRS